MSQFKFILLGLALLYLAACGSESIKRNTYQSLKTMEQHECLQDPGRDCPEPESYNKYEKQREEELKK